MHAQTQSAAFISQTTLAGAKAFGKSSAANALPPVLTATHAVASRVNTYSSALRRLQQCGGPAILHQEGQQATPPQARQSGTTFRRFCCPHALWPLLLCGVASLPLHSLSSAQDLRQQPAFKARRASQIVQSFAAAREASQTKWATTQLDGGVRWPLLPPNGGTADQLYGSLCLPETKVSEPIGRSSSHSLDDIRTSDVQLDTTIHALGTWGVRLKLSTDRKQALSTLRPVSWALRLNYHATSRCSRLHCC